MKIIIVGGVAGGASAATRARRVNPQAEIIIYEKGPAISFANCGLPYHLGGEIAERSKLLVATPELFNTRFNIMVKTNHEVISIDKENKSLLIKDNKNGLEFNDYYDKLILSTGSKLIELSEIPYDSKNVFTLWSLDDLDQIKSYIDKNKVNTATVIGAGFVGLEVVEQLKIHGICVQLIELAPQVLSPLDPEMATFIQEELEKHNIELHLSTKVESAITAEKLVTALQLTNGTSIKTDLVIVGVGVKPLSTLAQSAKLETSSNSAVKVNENGQTSDPNIYAVGDMAEYIYGPTSQPATIPLAGPANRAGRISGEHAASGTTQFKQKVYGTSIVRVFNKVAAATGLSEKLCKKNNISYRTAFISAAHHASYYPGAKEIILKLLYTPDTGKILGAQAVGEEGIDKRIDIISTLLHFGGTVEDLAALDLAYAPPFGSAKDPVHQIAFVALNDLSKSPELVSPNYDLSNKQFIDVRSDQELKNLPLSGSIHIPIDGKIPFYENPTFKELNPEKETIVICHSGKRAHIVASYLKGIAFKDVKNLSGGMMMRSRTPTQ